MIRVVLLEPDYWHRRGVTAALSEAAEIEIVRDDVRDADVVLLSLATIQELGLGEIERTASRYSAAVLVYGEVRDAALAADLFVAGALGYHASAFDPSLTKAVSLVADGQVWAPRAAVRVLAERLRGSSRDEKDGDLEILQLLNEGLSNKEIAQRLGLAESTVKTRMNRLCRRFGVSTRLQLLTAAIRQGLVQVHGDGRGHRNRQAR